MKLTSEKIVSIIKKYKYALLILLLGICLLLIPSGEKKKAASAPAQMSDEVYAKQMELALSQMLSKIDGAGNVEVMLTLQYGSTTQYHMDTQTQEDGERSTVEQKTVILSEGSAYDKAAVAAVRYPRFQGALVICRGAQQASVKLAIVEAVSALTGLSTDRITVVKMN